MAKSYHHYYMYIIEERTNYILLSKEVSADEEDAILDVSNI